MQLSCRVSVTPSFFLWNTVAPGAAGADIVGHTSRSPNPSAFENSNPLSQGVDLGLSTCSSWR